MKLDAAPVFEEIKLTGGLPLESWAAEVSLPSGLAVRFSAAATPAWIGSVVKGLPRRHPAKLQKPDVVQQTADAADAADTADILF